MTIVWNLNRYSLLTEDLNHIWENVFKVQVVLIQSNLLRSDNASFYTVEIYLYYSLLEWCRVSGLERCLIICGYSAVHHPPLKVSGPGVVNNWKLEGFSAGVTWRVSSLCFERRLFDWQLLPLQHHTFDFSPKNRLRPLLPVTQSSDFC